MRQNLLHQLMDKRNQSKLISYNCKSIKRSLEGVKALCQSADVIALQETWLLPHDLTMLNTIDEEFGATGTSAVDTAAGLLVGRPYGGVALLWRKTAFESVSVVNCDNTRIAAIKITKPVEAPIKEVIVEETEPAGSEGLREYGPPKVQEVSQDISNQGLPDADIDTTFVGLERGIETAAVVLEGNVEENKEAKTQEVLTVTEAIVAELVPEVPIAAIVDDKAEVQAISLAIQPLQDSVFESTERSLEATVASIEAVIAEEVEPKPVTDSDVSIAQDVITEIANVEAELVTQVAQILEETEIKLLSHLQSQQINTEAQVLEKVLDVVNEGVQASVVENVKEIVSEELKRVEEVKADTPQDVQPIEEIKPIVVEEIKNIVVEVLKPVEEVKSEISQEIKAVEALKSEISEEIKTVEQVKSEISQEVKATDEIKLTIQEEIKNVDKLKETITEEVNLGQIVVSEEAKVVDEIKEAVAEVVKELEKTVISEEVKVPETIKDVQIENAEKPKEIVSENLAQTVVSQDVKAAEEIKEVVTEVEKAVIAEEVKTVEAVKALENGVVEEVKSVVAGVDNIAQALAAVDSEIKAEQAEKATLELTGTLDDAPEGFLEYGPPGFKEYGPPKGDELLRAEVLEQELNENNEVRRRRFSPKFRPSNRPAPRKNH